MERLLCVFYIAPITIKSECLIIISEFIFTASLWGKALLCKWSTAIEDLSKKVCNRTRIWTQNSSIPNSCINHKIILPHFYTSRSNYRYSVSTLLYLIMQGPMAVLSKCVQCWAQILNSSVWKCHHFSVLIPKQKTIPLILRVLSFLIWRALSSLCRPLFYLRCTKVSESNWTTVVTPVETDILRVIFCRHRMQQSC